MGEVGFIGTGNIGAPMARRLIGAGHALVAFDRSPGALAAVVGAGAAASGSPREVASRCEVVFTSLPGPVEVASVVEGRDGLLAGASPGAVHVDLSTSSFAAVRALAEVEAAAGVTLVDAPVSGGSAGAERGTLTVMASGERAAFDRVRPLFAAFARSVFHLGESGSGTLVKLINNAIFLCAGLVAQEGFVLGAKAGLDPARLLEVLKTSSGGMYAGMVETTLKRDFANAFFSLALAEKDVSLAVESAHDLGVPARVIEAAHTIYSRAAAAGLGDQVFFSTLQALEDEAGVRVPPLTTGRLES